MTKADAEKAMVDITKLAGKDKAFMDLVRAIGMTNISYPAFKAYLTRK